MIVTCTELVALLDVQSHRAKVPDAHSKMLMRSHLTILLLNAYCSLMLCILQIFRLKSRVGSSFIAKEHTDLAKGELSAKEKADKVRELTNLYGTKKSITQVHSTIDTCDFNLCYNASVLMHFGGSSHSHCHG